MKIKNVKIYALQESLIRSGYPMRQGEPMDLETISEVPSDSIKRGCKLANAPIGSGHNNFLKGIIVQFDLQYPQYFTPQLQRYHWIDIVSSQSKMHKIMSRNLTQNDFSLPIPENILNYLNDLIKEGKFNEVINLLPCGFMQWMGISTNYLQLKTIYHQRKYHKLKNDWGYFCNWIETLPFTDELILNL